MSAADAPLRILLSSYFYPPSLGGVERQTQHLARGLVKRGHEVRVLAARLDGFAPREESDGVLIARLPAGRGSRWQKMATYLSALSRELIRARGWAHLVQIQQALYPAAAAALATAPGGPPLIVSNRGSGVAGAVSQMSGLPLGKLALRMIGAGAHCIGVNAETIAEMRGLGWKRLTQISNGVEIPVLSESARSEARRALGLSGTIVLFLGRLEPEKDLPLLIEAFTARPREGASLCLVGDGSERARAEQLAARLSPGAIRFAGAVKDASPWLRAADLFVLPSKSEGMSNALLEAMAHGLPALASDVGGNRQVIDRPEVGRLFAPGDPTALAALFDELLADAPGRAKLGRAARAHVQQTFSIDAMVEAHERLYRALAPTR